LDLKRDEVSEEKKKLHNEELHNLYASRISFGSSVKQGEMGGTCITHGRAEKLTRNIGRKTWREQTTRKTQASMRG